MRPSVVITVLLAGIAGLAVILFLKPPVNRPQPAASSMVQPVIPAPEIKPASPKISPPTNTAVSSPPKQRRPIPFTTPDVTGENAEFIQEQINRLEDLESNDDDASLQAILKELTNTNRLIRHVAIEATIQFGGHSAVPVLQDLAARTADPDEKKELLDAAEFLALPTISEVRAQKRLEQSPGAGQP